MGAHTTDKRHLDRRAAVVLADLAISSATLASAQT
jgi:hypothetical protein